MPVVIPWFLKREYWQHRSLDHDLPETFDEWHARATAFAKAHASASNRRVVKLVIHPWELQVWASRTNSRITDEARSAFAALIWQSSKRYGRSGAR